MIYLDNGATTRVAPEVIKDITYALENFWYNPSSAYQEGVDMRNILEESREKIARKINAEPEEIIFTSGGTEANNMAIQGICKANDINCVITSELEHASVYNTCKALSEMYLFYVEHKKYSGLINLHDLDKYLLTCGRLHRKPFASIMLVNNEIGITNPIESIASMVHRSGGIIHTDAVAAFPYMDIDVKELDVDLMSVSGHKFGCPKGIGFLYKKKGIELAQIFHGGHQENDYRAGTENLPYIYAMANQVERLDRSNLSDIRLKIRCLSYLIIKKIGTDKLYRSSENEDNNVLSLVVDNIDAQQLITMLNLNGVCVSAGAACCSGEKTPSRVLKEIGLSDKEANSTIRITINKDTTIEELDNFVDILKKCVNALTDK